MELLGNKKVIVFIILFLMLSLSFTVTPLILRTILGEHFLRNRNIVAELHFDFTPNPRRHYFLETFDFHLIDHRDTHLHEGIGDSVFVFSVSGTDYAAIAFQINYINEDEIVHSGAGGFGISSDGRLSAASIPTSEPFTSFQLLLTSNKEAIGTVSIYKVIE